MADVQFHNNVISVLNALGHAELAFLEEAAGELESQVKRNTSVDFGQLKASWRHKLNEPNMEAVVGSPLENAIWEELGTGEYALNGDGRKGSWYVPVEGYIGTKKPTYNGQVVIIHGKNGKSFYKTNGKRPKRAFFNAKQTVEPKIKQAAIDKFGSL